MRLIGLYTSMKVLGAPTTADGLSKAFGGDRKTYLKDLNALKKAGLLHRRIEKINGKPVTVTKLSDDSPLKGLLILLSQQNSSLILNANSIYKQIKNHGGAVMGDAMNEYELNRYEVDEEWEREQKRKYEKQKHEEYAREKEAHAAKRIEKKKTKTPAMIKAAEERKKRIQNDPLKCGDANRGKSWKLVNGKRVWFTKEN